MSVVVRAQLLGDVWETLGTERFAGAKPANVSLSSNLAGPDTASFLLARIPGDTFDLSPFTPVEFEVDGVLAWEGFIWDTPVNTEGDVTVNCRGWQYHLDDDLYRKQYVHDRLPDWREQTSFLGADLATYVQGAQIEVGQGAITLAWPANVASPAARWGVTLDLGPGLLAKRAVVGYECTTGDASGFVRLAGTDGESETGSTDNTETALSAGSPGVIRRTFDSPHRYIHIVYRRTAAFNFATDVYVKVTFARVFAETTYESSDLSTLKASDVITDVLTQNAPLLADDLGDVQATSFAIPHFNIQQAQTPREAIDAVNAFHRWQFSIGRNRRASFRAYPTIPIYAAAPAAGFEDASMNSGEAIYNKVVVEGTGADGAALFVERYASPPTTVGVTQPTNPSATTNTAGWAVGSGETLTRDTTIFFSSPGGFLVDHQSTTGDARGTMSQQIVSGFTPGTLYRVRVMARGADTFTSRLALQVGTGVSFGPITGIVAEKLHTRPGGTVWEELITPAFRATQDTYYIGVDGRTTAGGAINRKFYADDFVIELVPENTIPDRREFYRTKSLPVSAAMTTPAMNQVGDVFLEAHKRSPFQGSLSVNRLTLMNSTNGQHVDPVLLLYATGEMIRFPNIIDPDTGGLGRDGVISAVSYSADEGTAQVTIDNDRDNLEALLQRYAVVVGA